jgi:hypothetical protein
MARDHNPLLIDDFNGLWRRGGEEAVPLDHFSDCSDLVFNESEFLSRSGIDLYTIGDPPTTPYGSVARTYPYVYNDTEGLLVLDTLGNIYHTTSPTPGTPILSIPAMTDFAYYPINGRAFISPNNGITGLPNTFLYIYQGDGTPARLAGGKWPIGPNGFAAVLGGAGYVEIGYHVFAVTYITESGFETSPGPSDDSTDPNKMYYFAAVNADGNSAISLTNIPISPDAFVTTRRLYASVAIDPTLYTGDVTQYELFLIPGADLNDNTTTSTMVDFYDAELLQSSDDLFDLFSAIPAGVAITLYNNCMVLCTPYGDPATIATAGLISTAYVSLAGQPEAVNMVNGLIVAPLDGQPLTNASNFRGTLYIFKQTKTFAYNDNGSGMPSSWPLTVIDEGIGCSVHGLATILDSGSVNIDALILVDYSGIMYFNGIYIRPELSFKIRDLWLGLARSAFQNIQILNDSLDQYLYITLPTNQLLFADYSENLDPIKIKWSPWTFNNQVSTIAIINTNQLIIGSRANNT